MQRQSVRVIVASEYPQARDFLKEVVRGEEGASFVGQAQDATKAVTLARDLRPDVAIIDCNLPYSVGLDTVRLSRMGGLDTAQIISETIPGTRVIIITNLDRQVLPEHGLNRDAGTTIFREGDSGQNFFVLQEGKVALQMTLSESQGQLGRRVTVDVVNSNEIIGWSAVIEPYIYTLTSGMLAKSKGSVR